MGGGVTFPPRTNLMMAETKPMNEAEVDKILKENKYPAKEHAKKVVEWIGKNGGAVEEGGVIYLEGQKTRMMEDSDEAVGFRQRRYFYYLTGCDLPDSYYTYDIATQKSTLYIPPISPDDVIWSGLPLSPSEALQKYDIDTVLTSDDLNAYLSKQTTTIFTIPEQVSPHVLFSSTINPNILKTAVEECRVIKDTYEIALIRKANIVTTQAHTAVLKNARKVTNERELEGIFLERLVANGCVQAYHSIVASGRAAATLHYVTNDQPLAEKQNLLLDAAGSFLNYASDVTRTFPISGKFTPESLSIYSIVAKMQDACISKLKEGAVWDDIHILAHKIAISGLKDLGIFKGDEEEIWESRTSVAFFPHGLGHYLGMDTHDSGGHANYEDKDTAFRYLRVRGPVPAGSVITVEPGVYFCKFIIEPYLKDPKHSKFIDEKVLDKYWDVGGVRIEDNVLVTSDGYVNLTDAPKEAGDIMRIINEM